jgi:4-aminobutyrate aminotransferase-like enzyme
VTVLGRGDRLPAVRVEPPGPRSRALCRRLAAVEAPGINTVPGGEPTIVWRAARGANVVDADGNRYLDLTSGFGAAAVGHRHPRVVAAVRAQTRRLLHGLGDVHAHPLRPRLAERLAARAPVAGAGAPAAGGADAGVAVHFAVSGAEAVEIAVETALLATGRPEAVAFDPAYHGLTLGALALTSRPEFRRPFAPWLPGTVHRLPYGGPPAELARLLADRPGVGCCVFEPIAGREGVIVPPPGWLAAIGAECRARGVLTIADEVFTGFGRTGRWFAVEHELAGGAPAGGGGPDQRPDLLVCGKALGGGLPIAAVAGRRALMAAWETPGEALHTATHVANPLACAAALAVLDALERQRLVARAARLGARLAERIAPWPERYAAVVAVRGRGLMQALVLTDRAAAGRLVLAARRRGVLLLAGGPDGRVAQLLPPLTVTRRQLEAALDLVADALTEI